MVCIRAPERMGVFSRFVLFGVWKCKPLYEQFIPLTLTFFIWSVIQVGKG